MPGIGQETSGIREHSHKITEHAKIGKGCHLFGHACLMVVEPPCRAMLDLPGRAGILEASDDRTDDRIVVRVQRIEDGLWQLIRGNQVVEEVCKLACRGIIIDTVIPRNRTQFPEHELIIITLQP